MRILILLLPCLLLTGCYRRACEDDWSAIPATNNPSITRNSGSCAPPGM